MKETPTTEGEADKVVGYYNINNELQPGVPTYNPGRRENSDDKHYENNNLLPEGANLAQTSGKMEKIREKDYVNDDLFPEGSGGTKRTGQTKRREDIIDHSRNDQTVDIERKGSHREETDSVLDQNE